MSISNVIRCDLKSYLVWKWRPRDAEPDDSRANSIRWGSSLRVKEGEMALFIYGGRDGGENQDVIVGPFDKILETANLPVLASIVGVAYGGDSPFQAEVYFINLANNIQVLFGIPWFKAFDSRYPDLPVPVSARGTMTFNISDYKEFIRLNRLVNFNLLDFKEQIKMVVIKHTKSEIINKMRTSSIPLVQIESHVLEISDAVEDSIRRRITEFGVNLKSFDIDAIDIDESNPSYEKLQNLTIGIKERTTLWQSRLQVENLEKVQDINTENMRDSLQAQLQESQHAQRMSTDSQFYNVHTLNTQADVMKASAEVLGSAGGSVGGASGEINPASVMSNMMVGGAVAGQMAGMMNQGFQNMNQMMQNAQPGFGQQMPPSLQRTYFLHINGQQYGPYSFNDLQPMVASGVLNRNTYVWFQGMPQWDLAGNTELISLFSSSTPPPMPPNM